MVHSFEIRQFQHPSLLFGQLAESLPQMSFLIVFGRFIRGVALVRVATRTKDFIGFGSVGTALSRAVTIYAPVSGKD